MKEVLRNFLLMYGADIIRISGTPTEESGMYICLKQPRRPRKYRHCLYSMELEAAVMRLLTEWVGQKWRINMVFC